MGVCGGGEEGFEEGGRGVCGADFAPGTVGFEHEGGEGEGAHAGYVGFGFEGAAEERGRLE